MVEAIGTDYRQELEHAWLRSMFRKEGLLRSKLHTEHPQFETKQQALLPRLNCTSQGRLPYPVKGRKASNQEKTPKRGSVPKNRLPENRWIITMVWEPSGKQHTGTPLGRGQCRTLEPTNGESNSSG